MTLHHEMEVFYIWLWKCWVSRNLPVAKSGRKSPGLVWLALLTTVPFLKAFLSWTPHTTLSCSLPAYRPVLSDFSKNWNSSGCSFVSPFLFLLFSLLRSIFWPSQSSLWMPPKVDLHLGPLLWNPVLFIQLPISYLHYISHAWEI